MHSLIEYNDVYSKTFESLWQYYRGEPALDNNNIIDSYAKNNNSISFRFKEKQGYGTNRRQGKQEAMAPKVLI